MENILIHFFHRKIDSSLNTSPKLLFENPWKHPHKSNRIDCLYWHAYSAGIKEEFLEATNIKVYNIPKTVADCFKYRNKIGNDIAIEALRETLV